MGAPANPYRLLWLSVVVRAVKDARGEAMGEYPAGTLVRSAIIRSARNWLRGVNHDELGRVLRDAGIHESIETFTRRFKEEFPT